MSSKIVYMPVDTSDFNSPVNSWLHDFGRIMSDQLYEKLKGEQKEEDTLISADEGRKLFHPAPCRLTFRTWMRKAGIEEHHIGNRIFYSKDSVLTAAKTLKKYKRA